MKERSNRTVRFRRSYFQKAKEGWRRFCKNRAALFGFVLLCMILFFILFADVFANYQQDAIEMGGAPGMLAPSLVGLFDSSVKAHIFGTDIYGRDLFARLLFGGRNTLLIGVLSTLMSVSAGGILGATAAYFGKKTDNFIMRIMDIISCIPAMLLTLAIIAACGSNIFFLLLGLTIASIPNYARIIRSVVITINGQDFIEAAKACGTSDARIIAKHILPNAIGLIIIQATVSIASMILLAASLSYLGMGIQPPAPEWGIMLSEGKNYMRTLPYLIIIPGVALVLSALSISLVGDGLRDALDPRLKN